MMCFTVKTALLLCGLSWIYLSVTECRMVEVQPGEDVTLLCSNFSSSPSQIIWYKLVNGTHPRCISSIFSSTQPASFCSGVEPDRFELTSNSSTLFFKIKQVDLADSGFYFCGFYYKTHPVIVNSTYLQVQDRYYKFLFSAMVIFCISLPCKKSAKMKQFRDGDSKVDMDIVFTKKSMNIVGEPTLNF
uniref:Ig-like domain-containing protein n=1 Tax=Amphiprion ocellaris TaxID=80972 RepID=A0A3Q1C5F9_AMPOC